MIRKIDVTIAFPRAARFSNNLDFYVYKKWINLIKKTSCINSLSKCKDCTYRTECSFYKYTGDNFMYYPALIMPISYFPKLSYKHNEEKIFSFYLIGNSYVISDYVNILFEDVFNQVLCGNVFYLKNIQVFEEKEIIKTRTVKVKTVIEEEKTFSMIYNNMIHYYNDIYKTNFEIISEDEKNVSLKKVEVSEFNLGSKRRKPKGIVGTYLFQNNISLPLYFLNTGIGRFNFIGGGQIEIED